MTTPVVTVTQGINDTWDCLVCRQGKASEIAIQGTFLSIAIIYASVRAEREQIPYIPPLTSFLTVVKHRSTFTVIESHASKNAEIRGVRATFQLAIEFANSIGQIEQKTVVPHFWIAPDKTTI